MSASDAWVPHPRRVLVFAARVGNRESKSFPFISIAEPKKVTA